MTDPFPDGAITEAFIQGTLGDATIHLAHPFETLTPDALWADALGPLHAAFPDLERRPYIFVRGTDAHGQTWLGIAGDWIGTFRDPFLGIPATRRAASMRFHDFFRIEDGRITEMQSLWDIPELMIQAGAWPMGPSLGRDWRAPSPMTQDGLGPHRDGAEAFEVVSDMLNGLHRSPEGVEAMGLPRYWHPRCAWYGPAGIGTARGIEGFRRHHQIPFLGAMPDRVGLVDQGHFFAAGDYVAFTAWPGMEMTLSGSGWLGIPPTGARLTMRSLDFWRVRDGLIRENWVLVDLLHVWDQLGVDVLARMRELTGP